jgi:hypothetical protein
MFTVFRLCAFMQSIIGACAIPVLEGNTVWGSNPEYRSTYLDTTDIAIITINSLKSPLLLRRTVNLRGSKE